MSPRNRTSPWRPSSAKATEICNLEASRPTKAALPWCMARPLCVRLGAGPSGATLVRRIAQDAPPPLRQRTYGLPDVLGGVELRAFGREHHERDVVWNHEAGREVPSGLVDDEYGVLAGSHFGGDFGEGQVHRLGVAGGPDRRRPPSLSRADRPPEVR